jgi:ATP synthase protein I
MRLGKLSRAKVMGEQRGYLRYLALVGEVGLILVVCIGGGLLAGVLLDRWLGTSPAFTLVLLLAGIAAGFLQVFRLLLPRGRR